MANKVRLSVRMSQDLHDAIEDARWKARLSQNEFLVRLISDALAAPRPQRGRPGRRKQIVDEPT